ncbi:MAG TPA: MFS transporter [Acidothermaceae bacterium]
MGTSSRRWLILGLGWAAQAAMCCYVFGLPMLVPAIRHTYGISLARSGVVVASPGFGVLFTLFAWGYAADRWGERLVITVGLAGASVFLTAACLVHGLIALCALLALAGAAGASVNAASGRVVLGWFDAHERGFAMGVRQTAQPLGVGLAALTLPALARHGLSTAFVFPAALCAVVAVLVLALVTDPPRAAKASAAARSPYRTAQLWRVHGSSMLLVVPQFAVSAFVLEYLVNQRNWGVLAAGRLVFAMQVAGAAGRVGAGAWSDRVGSRLRPMRQIAVASALTMVAIAIGDARHAAFVVVAFAVGAVVTVTDNGLGFTAAAEIAGTAWAGRALGAQNTAQNIAAILTPPLLGVLIESTSYSTGFLVASIFPVVAVALTPVPRRADVTFAALRGQ